jgi:hypothetical protein
MPLARVPVPSTGIIPKGDKDAILNSIVETYRSSTTSEKDHHRKKYKGKPRNKLHKISKHLPLLLTNTLTLSEEGIPNILP